MTATDVRLGTPKYIAPEVWRGEPTLPASDQFSLAVVAFYILTGKRPFDADSWFGVMTQITSLPAPAASSLSVSLPRRIDPVLQKALSKHPDDRFACCTAFIEALEQAFVPATTRTLRRAWPADGIEQSVRRAAHPLPHGRGSVSAMFPSALLGRGSVTGGSVRLPPLGGRHRCVCRTRGDQLGVPGEEADDSLDLEVFLEVLLAKLSPTVSGRSKAPFPGRQGP